MTFVNDTTIVAGDAPLLEILSAHATELLVESLTVSRKLAQPADTYSDHRKNQVAAALSIVLRNARVDGVTDEELFAALAVATGWWLQRQELSPDRDLVLARLSRSALIAIALADGAAETGFPTRGDRMTRTFLQKSRQMGGTLRPGNAQLVERSLARATFRAMTAGPTLLAAAKAALPLVTDQLNLALEAHCNLDADLRPKIETLEDVARPYVEEPVRLQEQLVAAILRAEGA